MNRTSTLTHSLENPVSSTPARSRKYYLLAGILIGMACSYYLPHEPAYADSVDHSQRFAVCTAQTTVGNSEAVFVLDFVTGRLVGASHNTQAGSFTQSWVYNVAADFNAGDDAQYVMVPGYVSLRGTAGATPALGGIYIAELNSGIVNLYGFNYIQGNRVALGQPMIPIAQFPFRDVIN